MAAALLLVGATAFFVAVEFALVAVDRGRIEQRANEGRTGERRVLGLLRQLSFHLSGAQLGITVSSLLLGLVAEPAVADLLEQPLDSVGAGRGWSIVIALTGATFISMVFGELVPKSLAIAHPERLAIVLSRPAHMFGVVFGPLIRALNELANRAVRLVGIEPVEELASVRSIEDLEMLIRSSGEGGEIDTHDVQILTRSIRFTEKDAGSVLVPRVDVTALSSLASVADMVALAARTGFSRFPVYGTDLDDVRGVAHVKTAFDVDRASWPHTRVESIMSPVRAVPESRSLEGLLSDLRSSGSQLAVVVDEYGGTAGIVTLEDVLEEIVGEIDDEHDPWTPTMTPGQAAGCQELDASLHADEVGELCGFHFPEGEYDTLAGFVLDRLGHIPVVGERVDHDGWTIEVTGMDHLRIDTVSLTPPANGH